VTAPENMLPYDGIALYYGAVMDARKADRYFEELINNVSWQSDEVVIYGRRHILKRQTAWYGDKDFEYKYSGTKRTALQWTATLTELKSLAEKISGETYNSCLLNLYHDGADGMSWHADDEKMLKKEGAIASMSFGAERKFSFKHRQSKETRSVLLAHGSLMVMRGEIQRHWLHALPKSLKVKTPRINLTFRTIIE
jgi:alkylated DNA repair dioxygenase AlkB